MATKRAGCWRRAGRWLGAIVGLLLVGLALVVLAAYMIYSSFRTTPCCTKEPFKNNFGL